MGKTYTELNDKLIAFIKAQKMFFVATAPLTDQLKRSHTFKSVEDWHNYRYDKNPESLDGLPGLIRPGKS